MDSKRLEEFCRLGERADKLLREGRTRDALKTYEEITSRLESAGEIDSYLMAKVTLGTLRCLVKLGEFKEAYRIWNAGLEDSLHGIGIYALESAQTTVRDMLTYDMICAFLHSLAASEKQDAAAAINQYLSRVCEQAEEEGDRDLMAMAISNWKQHLRDVFQSSFPHEFAVALIRFEKDFGTPVKPRAIDFPLPTEWEKPNDFREMSRVVHLKAAERAAAPVPHATVSKRKIG